MANRGQAKEAEGEEGSEGNVNGSADEDQGAI